MARLPPVAPPRVLSRDEHLLVVDKPPGLATTSPDGGDCLAARVRALDPHAEKCHPSSRLDAEVSGVVVFARTSRAIQGLLAAREQGRYARRYVALAPTPAPASTLASADDATWSWSIALDPRDPRKRRALDAGAAGERAQEAQTHAHVLARSDAGLSLRLEPVTGRTHQLRVHAARAGIPLLGDVSYGGARRLVTRDGSVIACPRVALHCLVVVLPGPDGELVAFRSELPPDLASMLESLGLPDIDTAAIERHARDALR